MTDHAQVIQRLEEIAGRHELWHGIRGPCRDGANLIAALSADLATARVALRFYADPQTYEESGTDKGARARAVLAAGGEER